MAKKSAIRKSARTVIQKDGVSGRSRAASGETVRKTAGQGGDWGVAATFMDAAGVIDIGRVATLFHMSRGQIAETAGLAASSVGKTDRQASSKVQSRVAEILEIINRVKDWAGGEAQAMAWFRSQPIPALDGRTAEALVKGGRAAAVRDYLDHLALGGYA